MKIQQINCQMPNINSNQPAFGAKFVLNVKKGKINVPDDKMKYLIDSFAKIGNENDTVNVNVWSIPVKMILPKTRIKFEGIFYTLKTVTSTNINDEEKSFVQSINWPRHSVPNFGDLVYLEIMKVYHKLTGTKTSKDELILLFGEKLAGKLFKSK